MRRFAPFRVTVLLWMVLTLTAWNAVRLWTAIAWRERLAEFAPSPGPFYIGLTGAIWTGVGLVVLWAVWKGKPWTLRLLAAGALAYTAWYWADRLLLQQEHANWGFMLLVNVSLLVYVFLTIRWLIHQREAYEREPENYPAE
jgi:hypothetical protein